MNEKGRGGSDSLVSEAKLIMQETGENPDDYEAFARRYLACIASAMYHAAPGGETPGGTYNRNVNLARFDSHGNLSEDEFDIYRIKYKASENGGIGECHVYKIIPSKDDPQEATMQEITAQDANLDTCNTLGRIWKKLAVSRKSKD
jgi:hypothetical protein